MSRKLKAFNNKQSVKDNYIKRLEDHYKADEIAKGFYWENGKGCAVGCTIHGSSHNAYEKELGIPESLARLEDTLFEGLPNDLAKEFPLPFLKAINVGADLSRVSWQFLYWNLTENLILKDSDNEKAQKVIIQCREAIKQVGDAISPLVEKGGRLNKKKLESAWAAAWAAAESARSAAESAAWAAAESAWAAAESARSATRSAARSAYVKMADKLIELLKNAV